MTADERPSGTGLRGAMTVVPCEDSEPHDLHVWTHKPAFLHGDKMCPGRAHPSPGKALAEGARLSEVLAEHRPSTFLGGAKVGVCSCGWVAPDSDSWPAWHAHLAAALEPVVAARVAEAKATALWEAADEIDPLHLNQAGQILRDRVARLAPDVRSSTGLRVDHRYVRREMRYRTTYRHDHDCSRKDTLLTKHYVVKNGVVVFDNPPMCVETQMELAFDSWELIPDPPVHRPAAKGPNAAELETYCATCNVKWPCRYADLPHVNLNAAVDGFYPG